MTTAQTALGTAGLSDLPALVEVAVETLQRGAWGPFAAVVVALVDAGDAVVLGQVAATLVGHDAQHAKAIAATASTFPDAACLLLLTALWCVGQGGEAAAGRALAAGMVLMGR